MHMVVKFINLFKKTHPKKSEIWAEIGLIFIIYLEWECNILTCLKKKHPKKTEIWV